MNSLNKSEIEKLHDTIETIKRENERLKKSVKSKKYGLVWMDVPEAFEKESENKLPILKEVKDKAIVNDDGKPTHIIIEGENYHALTCLNYTHKEKIDVIYIDPPYNTGNDGFKYKDKRFLTKYPDGTDVPKDSPFRHSYWLSFMSKRLELAKNLLKDTGVIFISIDDNEIAQLKLLCDKNFGAENFLATIVRRRRKTQANLTKNIAPVHEYLVCYAKNISSVALNNLPLRPEYVKKMYKNPDNDPRGLWRLAPLLRPANSSNREFELTMPNGRKIKGKWSCSEETFKKYIEEKLLVVTKDGSPNKKVFLKESEGQIPNTWWNEIASNEEGAKEIENIFGTNAAFIFPKPTGLIVAILQITSNKNSIVLDFFAGSGTTLHATMALNLEDSGNRQCILVNNNENKICETVTYERNKKVIHGYTKPDNETITGLGNSLKYYRAAFIGENDISKANDEDIVKLAHHAGELLALAENTLYGIEQNDYYQIFKSEKRFTAIYFREEFNQFEKFVSEVEKLKNPVSIYVFSWGNQNEFEVEFEHIRNIRVKSIPQPILEIYQSIYNLIPQQ